MGAYWSIESISLDFLEEKWIDWNMKYQIFLNIKTKLILQFVNTKCLFLH